MSDEKILELALQKLSAEFDGFISECIDENQKPKCPSMQAIMRAKGCLPFGLKNAYKKKVKV